MSAAAAVEDTTSVVHSRKEHAAPTAERVPVAAATEAGNNEPPAAVTASSKLSPSVESAISSKFAATDEENDAGGAPESAGDGPAAKETEMDGKKKGDSGPWVAFAQAAAAPGGAGVGGGMVRH